MAYDRCWTYLWPQADELVPMPQNSILLPVQAFEARNIGPTITKGGRHATQ